jgi:hypothetical protein
VAFARAEPADGRGGIDERYDRASADLRRALSTLGVDAREGEPEDSFCPGTHSLQASGKVVGIAQRVRKGAAVTAGIVLVRDHEAVASVLQPVYSALGTSLDPDSVGSVARAGGESDPDGEPWFAVNENYPDVNVAAARADDDSVWHHYRRLIDLRARTDALVYGDYDLLVPTHEQLYAYTRTLDDERVLVVLNWSAEPATVRLDGVEPADATLLVGNYDDPAGPTGGMRPYEATVYRL